MEKVDWGMFKLKSEWSKCFKRRKCQLKGYFLFLEDDGVWI